MHGSLAVRDDAMRTFLEKEKGRQEGQAKAKRAAKIEQRQAARTARGEGLSEGGDGNGTLVVLLLQLLTAVRCAAAY